MCFRQSVQRRDRRTPSGRTEPHVGAGGGIAAGGNRSRVHGDGRPHRWVATETATRVCTTILDRTTGTITELVENGRPLAPRELDEFHRTYAEAATTAQIVVITGSLPSGTPVSFYRRLVECTPCPVVLDFRGEGLLSVLDRQPYVVKPNREELAGTLGRPITTDDDLRDAMHSSTVAGPGGW